MFKVIGGGQPIGTAELSRGDSDMGIASGRFYPLPAYESVRSVFLLYTQSFRDTAEATDKGKLARYYEARDKLNMSLETPDGKVVLTEWIHIIDWSELNSDTTYEIEAEVTDPAFWHTQ